jgi:hypothetical protein
MLTILILPLALEVLLAKLLYEKRKIPPYLSYMKKNYISSLLYKKEVNFTLVKFYTKRVHNVLENIVTCMSNCGRGSDW